MANKLVIVESPSKAKTIKKYLGSDYDVIASQGHIIDLPASRIGVDTENGFKPEYIKMKGKAKLIKDIKVQIIPNKLYHKKVKITISFIEIFNYYLFGLYDELA